MGFFVEEYPLRIVRQAQPVGRRRKTRVRGLRQIGGDDDDEIGLAALRAVRAEQRAEDWDHAIVSIGRYAVTLPTCPNWSQSRS
jgi:hypothetical protein